MIRVQVADDQRLVRESFRILVDSAPGLETAGEAGTGRRRSPSLAGSSPTSS